MGMPPRPMALTVTGPMALVRMATSARLPQPGGKSMNGDAVLGFAALLALIVALVSRRLLGHVAQA
jgi:hypothetical protein